MKFVIQFLIFNWLSLSYSQAYQVNNYKGTVKDKSSNLPLPGANIVIIESNIGYITDFDGIFSFENSEKTVRVEVSSIGYKTKIATLNFSDNIELFLEESVEALDEVVVTGYGSQIKRDLTGSVAVLGSKQIDKIRPIKLEQALQGTVAGVNVSTQSGAPGAGINIRIRGISTNGDASPVAIIDGYQGDLSLLNPSDIESITVLKDAQAAIYGTIGANGVLLITTKQGRKDSPTKFIWESSLGVQTTSRELPLLSAKEYGILLNESYTNDGRFPVISNVSELDEGFDWQNEIFRNAAIERHALTLTGGSISTKYSVGASSLKQQGIVGLDKSSFERKTFRSNVSFDLSDNLNLNTSVIYTNIRRNSINDFGLGSVLFNAINMPPIYNAYDENNDFTLAPSNLGIEIINPLAQVSNTFNDYRLDKINGTIGLEYSPFDGFTFSSRIGFNAANSKSRNFSKLIDYGGKVFDVTRSSVNQNRINNNDYSIDNFINYKFALNEQQFAVTIGSTIFRNYGDALFATGFDVPNNSWENADISLANGTSTEKTSGSYSYDQRRLSYFARIQYDIQNKIFFSGLMRRDASTKFGPQNRIGIFPSLTGGYILSEEQYFKKIDWIDFFKIRASYGLLGSDKIGDFLYLSQLTGEGVYVFDNQLSFGRAIGVVPNSAIKWEASEQLDLGLDVTFSDFKFNVTFDYFQKTTNDLLIQNIPVSGILGVRAPGSGSPTVNAGEIFNEGYELMLKYSTSFGENFYMSSSINATTLNNRVTKVNNNVGFIEGGSFGVGQQAPSRMEVGFPIGYFYGYETDGIFQNRSEVISHPSQIALGAPAAPGDFRYKDLNEDGVIDDKDRTYIGDPIPDFTFGYNLNLNYKNIDFSLNAFASVGQEIVRNYERVQLNANKLNYYIERWRGEGTSNSVPRMTTRATSNNVFSDFFVEDGSFIRLQTIQLGYSLPTSLLEKIQLDQFRLFVTAENVLTLTRYKGYDPAASSGSPVGSGIDNGFYPIPKTITAGVNIKF
jgi:TonB-dependent starch-binding outer membrane protein SusC